MNPRLLLIGDSIAKTSGFANVLRHLADAANRDGWWVEQIASADDGSLSRAVFSDLRVKPYFSQERDPRGFNVLRRAVLNEGEPDVIFINADPGSVNMWFAAIDHFIPKEQQPPVVAYMPIENSPIAYGVMKAFERADVAVAYTQWAAGALKREWGMSVPWTPHGVDTNVYKPKDQALRAHTRTRLGWQGKFVVSYVARNQLRKAHDRVIKAAAELKAMGEADDVLIYLHAKGYDDNWNGGWDLPFLINYCDVGDVVQLAPEYTWLEHDPISGVLEREMADIYRASDLYLHPSTAEGFGLPLLEAMACGLPVVCTHDNANIIEVVGDAALAYIHPFDYGTWHNGVQLAHLSPADIASTIVVAKNNAKARVAASERGLARAALYPWQRCQDELLAACRLAIMQAQEARLESATV